MEIKVKEYEDDIVKYELPKVGENRGIKFSLRRVGKILKNAGYSPHLARDFSISLGIIYIDIGTDYGTITIYKNGEIYGGDIFDNLNIDVNSEDEVIPAIEEIAKDLEKQYKERKKKGNFEDSNYKKMEYESDTTIGGKVNWITNLILKEKLKDNPNQQRVRELQLLWDNLPD